MEVPNPRHDRFSSLIKTTQIIPRKYLNAEAELLLLKWPSYRFMPPLQATQLFHDCYRKAYQAFLRENVDLELSRNTTIGRKLSWSKRNKFLTQLWIARQTADRFGAPYDDYLEFAFQFAQRRTRQQPPQPNQLGPNINTDQAWRAKWDIFWSDDRRKIALNRMKPMLQYALMNDRGLPAQERFRDEVIATLDTTGHPGSYIANHVVARQTISEEHLRSRIGNSQLARMLIEAQEEVAAGRLEVASFDTARSVDFWQSCLGMPGVDINAEDTCRFCPMKHECEDVRNLCLKDIRSITGSDDPIGDEERRKTRERVQRHRAKTKAHAETVTMA